MNFLRSFFLTLLLTASMALPSPALAQQQVEDQDQWELFHRQVEAALADLSRQSFGPGSARRSLSASHLQPLAHELAPHPGIIVVGFTGGMEKKDSRASGIATLNDRIGEHAAALPQVVPLAYNNFFWRRAATDVRRLAQQARSNGDGTVPQPLIVVYGHSWGAASIDGFARELRKDDLEISLAIYIDAVTLRNPRVPVNVRYAVNLYQRAGFLKGLPLRGKRKLIPRDPEFTRILGSYKIKPSTDRWGWSWNLIQPLFYRQHHRIGHDARLQQYLLDIVNLKLTLFAATEAPPEAPLAVTALGSE